MNLTSAERTCIPGTETPALCLEGSAVPRISVMPLTENSVRLSVWLRDFASPNTRSYEERRATLHVNDLAGFFADYFTMPEATLAAFFGWKDQKAGRVNTQGKPVAAAPNELADFLNLF
jgi:hypothetical protein